MPIAAVAFDDLKPEGDFVPDGDLIGEGDGTPESQGWRDPVDRIFQSRPHIPGAPGVHTRVNFSTVVRESPNINADPLGILAADRSHFPQWNAAMVAPLGVGPGL